MSEALPANSSMQRFLYRKIVKDLNLKSGQERVGLRSCKLVGKIVKVEGECTAGHHVGEDFDLTLHAAEGKTPRTPSVCGFLYYAIFPYLTTLQFEGIFPWEKDKDRMRVGCPDNQKVIIEIRRIGT